MRPLPRAWRLIRPSTERPDPFPDTCDGWQEVRVTHKERRESEHQQPTVSERHTETAVEDGATEGHSRRHSLSGNGVSDFSM